MGKYRGSRGTILYDALELVGNITAAKSIAGMDVVTPADAATLVKNKLSLIQNSTTDANTAALFTLPTPSNGMVVDLSVIAYTTSGTDSIKVKSGSTAIIIGPNSSENVAVFGAAGQYLRLVGNSATRWYIVGQSTGVTYAAST